MLDWYEVWVRNKVTLNKFILMRVIVESEEEACQKANDKLDNDLSKTKRLLSKFMIDIKAQKMEPHELLNVDLTDDDQLLKFTRPNQLIVKDSQL